MNPREPTVSLILAAGLSTRFGSSKALIKIERETMVERLSKFYATCSDRVVVVTGFQADLVEARIDTNIAEIVRNRDYDLGVLSSLSCGLRHIQATEPSFGGVIISPVDFPLDDLAVLRVLLAQSRKKKQFVVIPLFDNEMGYPIWASREAVNLLLAETSTLSEGEQQTKYFLSTIPEHGVAEFAPPPDLQDRISFVKVNNSDILANFNTPEMFTDWLAKRGGKTIK